MLIGNPVDVSNRLLSPFVSNNGASKLNLSCNVYGFPLDGQSNRSALAETQTDAIVSGVSTATSLLLCAAGEATNNSNNTLFP